MHNGYTYTGFISSNLKINMKEQITETGFGYELKVNLIGFSIKNSNFKP